MGVLGLTATHRGALPQHCKPILTHVGSLCPATRPPLRHLTPKCLPSAWAPAPKPCRRSASRRCPKRRSPPGLQIWQARRHRRRKQSTPLPTHMSQETFGISMAGTPPGPKGRRRHRPQNYDRVLRKASGAWGQTHWDPPYNWTRWLLALCFL